MSLNRGKKIQDVSNDVWWQNYHRLLIWMNVGADVKNGLFSIMGARLGCHKVLGTDWDYNNTRDFEYLNTLWKDEYQGYDEALCKQAIHDLGKELQALDLPISENALDDNQSKFFKEVYKNSPRVIR